MSKGLVDVSLIEEARAVLKKANVLWWFLLVTVVLSGACAVVLKSTEVGIVCGIGAIALALLHRKLTYTTFLIESAEELNKLIKEVQKIDDENKS